MELILIAAVSLNGVIGKNGEIPWKIKEDMARFRELTTPYSVIMGRKTYESIPKKFRPLANRHNIVLTRNPDFSAEGIQVVHSLDEAIEEAGNNPCETLEQKAYVIGGEAIYREAIVHPNATRLEITRVKKTYL